MKETNTIIEIASSKDQSLTFLITGKPNQVLEAKRRILTTFQTQVFLILLLIYLEDTRQIYEMRTFSTLYILHLSLYY